eukprot:gnl/MRDRNA2_/MRDRNA2_119398_c0_seq1.p1 gnl/MRDRNA2_/MRDRNA2_119398_c0~~gnl/MRDRNA2_/MRDRNA2_119398_c0_seq1.p1  ORF type:complete len:168 (+),score=27.03 gnl/MRDRNA2_/MRDRNA2_119398_c0_seq1:54-506(+)
MASKKFDIPSDVLSKATCVIVLAVVVVMLQGCGEEPKTCEEALENKYDQLECQSCVSNVKDTPFEKKGYKQKLIEKCQEGHEGRKEVEAAIHERLDEKHNNTRPEQWTRNLRRAKESIAGVQILRKPTKVIQQRFFDSMDGHHDASWYLP